MKLLGSPKNKIIKNKNGKNVPHSEITAVVLVHCNIANNDFSKYFSQSCKVSFFNDVSK